MNKINTNLNVELITDIQQSPANEIAPEGSDGTWRLHLGEKIDSPYVTVTHKWFNANNPQIGNYLAIISGKHVVFSENEVKKMLTPLVSDTIEKPEVIHEFKVRDVKRYVLTEFQSNSKDRTVSSGVVAEFTSVDQAEAVGLALQKINLGSTFISYGEENKPKKVQGPKAYVVVAVHTFEIDTKACFADSYDGALLLKEQLSKQYDTEFKIFHD